MQHVLIESIDAIAAAQKSGFGREVVWHTSSPAVIEHLSAQGKRVEWLEDSIDLSLGDRVGQQVVAAIEALRPDLETIAADLNTAEFVPVISLQLHQTLCALLYKQATLTRWRAVTGGGTVVGERRLTIPGNGNVSCDSFDTLYALLATHPDNSIDVLDHVETRPNLRAIKDRPSVLGRILSLADISSGQLAWRWLRYVSPKKRMAFSRNGARILVLRENEIIREMLPHLLARGASVELLSISVTGAKADEAHPGVPEKARLEACLVSADAVERNVRPVAATLHHLLTEASRFWRPVTADVERNVSRFVADGRRAILLTNTPPGIAGAATIAALRRRGVRIVIAEHGVSAGLSAVYLAMRPWTEATLADDYLVCSENTRRFFAQERTGIRGRIHTIGLAQQIREVPLRGLQKALARRMLKAGHERVVIYLARPEQNNQRRLPYSPHDRDVYQLQKSVVCEVLPRLNGCPVFKTYPSRRYPDESPLGSSLVLPKPVRVISTGDFRYLRAAASIIILESFMSTFGFTFGAHVPVVLLRQHGIEPLPHVEAAIEKAVFVFDTRQPGWKERLIAFLNQDQAVIDRAWSEKAAEREAFTREYVFGPPHAGRHAADVVLGLAVVPEPTGTLADIR